MSKREFQYGKQGFSAERDFVRVGVHEYGAVPNSQGNYFLTLVERYGLIAGTAGKEDSGGRATLVLQEPEFVIERAAALTTLAFERLDSEGWTVDVLSIKEIKALKTEPEPA